MSRPVLFPDATVALPPRLFPGAEYYAAMAAFGHAVIDSTARYDKRAKSVHRYRVADVRGTLELTVPVSRPSGTDAPGWNNVTVSRHGNWWHVHRLTLESAYGRTPFFEFIIDRFDSLFSDPGGDAPPSVIEFARRADHLVRSILGYDNVEWTPIVPDAAVDADFRRSMPSLDSQPPYYQVRAGELGFIPGLSVLDIIFNLGPEAQLYLNDLAYLTFGR
ncbi:MAG: WbqC family protein [Odoribacter sp.]|nr:WbqC family protein [Odoribacter sp.]